MDEKPTEPTKFKFAFNWWYIPTALCGIAFLVSAIFYVITVNMALVLVILPALGGAVASGYKLMHFSNIKFEGISEMGPVTGDVNAFCIYGKMIDKVCYADNVAFENIEKARLKGDR